MRQDLLQIQLILQIQVLRQQVIHIAMATKAVPIAPWEALQQIANSLILVHSFLNNTGYAINSITVSYTVEQWRLGATGRKDSMPAAVTTVASNVYLGFGFRCHYYH